MKAKAEVMHSAFFLYLEVIPGKEKRGRSTPRWYIQVLQKVKLPVTGFSYALLLFVDNSYYASWYKVCQGAFLQKLRIIP